ncbi:hypothetical protein GRI34_12035 [Erythrobacter aquimaris]|uniref:Uncharacterized protein n=1 Tax=Qipengyuania aquimaris TaxID=255984 RepID=A0A6I4TMV7_9SPHN|nr:hypothetical protein [Qipengyuania aquimaris]MXO97146.1 hypothetical protein [Qipengyuania aquimaris]
MEADPAHARPRGARQKATFLGVAIFLALAGFTILAASDWQSASQEKAGLFRVALQPNQMKTRLPTIQPLAQDSQAADVQSVPAAVESLGGESPTDQAPEVELANNALPKDVMKLSYRLEPAFDGGPDGVQVQKNLVREGTGETSLPIFLMGGTRIEIEREALASAMTKLGLDQQAISLPEQQRLTLENVRASGVDLAYDAIRDTLVLKSAAEEARP